MATRCFIGPEWEVKRVKIRGGGERKWMTDIDQGSYQLYAETGMRTLGLPFLAVTEDQGNLLEIIGGPCAAEAKEQEELGRHALRFLKSVDEEAASASPNRPTLTSVIDRFNANLPEHMQLQKKGPWADTKESMESITLELSDPEEGHADVFTQMNVSLPLAAYWKVQWEDVPPERMTYLSRLHSYFGKMTGDVWKKELRKILPGPLPDQPKLSEIEEKKKETMVNNLLEDDEVRSFFTYLFLWGTMRWLRSFTLAWMKGRDAPESFMHVSRLFEQTENLTTREKNEWALLPKATLQDSLRAIRSVESRRLLAEYYGPKPEGTVPQAVGKRPADLLEAYLFEGVIFDVLFRDCTGIQKSTCVEACKTEQILAREVAAIFAYNQTNYRDESVKSMQYGFGYSDLFYDKVQKSKDFGKHAGVGQGARTSAVRPLPLIQVSNDKQAKQFGMVVETRFNSHPWSRMLTMQKPTGEWKIDTSQLKAVITNIRELVGR